LQCPIATPRKWVLATYAAGAVRAAANVRKRLHGKRLAHHRALTAMVGAILNRQ
jgi:hypothetical protein